MKLVILFSASCAAFLLPKRDRDNSPVLVTRVGEQGTSNIDNEPDFEHPNGDKQPMSLALTGLGNAESDNRWFDFDESCSDANQRRKILSTFSATMKLAGWASNYLDSMKDNLPNPIQPKKSDPENRAYIFAHEPAYAQMFKGFDNQIDYVKESYDLVLSRAVSFSGRNEGGSDALRFICSAKNQVMNADRSVPYCGENAETQARTSVPVDGEIEPRYRFQNTASIVFCPLFFDDEKFPNIQVVKDNVDEPYLSNVECSERIMLHEYMHLPWIRDMPGGKNDKIGFFDAADLASKWPWGTIRANPDNYAWLALYTYFNRHSDGLGCDVWPENVEKPVKPPR